MGLFFRAEGMVDGWNDNLGFIKGKMGDGSGRILGIFVLVIPHKFFTFLSLSVSINTFYQI